MGNFHFTVEEETDWATKLPRSLHLPEGMITKAKFVLLGGFSPIALAKEEEEGKAAPPGSHSLPVPSTGDIAATKAVAINSLH